MSENTAAALIREQLEPLVTVAELAEIEGLGKNYIYDGVKLHGWPHYKRNRQIKFSLEQILQIREMERRDARPPVRRAPRRRPRKTAAA